MIKQQATVISCDEKTVLVEVERQSTCSQCQVKQGCGTSLLENHVGKRFSQISVAKTNDVLVGQQVQLAISEQNLLQATFLMYIVPLLVMFICAAVTSFLNFNELVEIFSGICGLLISFYWVRIYLRNKDNFNIKMTEEIQ